MYSTSTPPSSSVMRKVVVDHKKHDYTAAMIAASLVNSVKLSHFHTNEEFERFLITIKVEVVE